MSADDSQPQRWGPIEDVAWEKTPSGYQYATGRVYKWLVRDLLTDDQFNGWSFVTKFVPETDDEFLPSDRPREPSTTESPTTAIAAARWLQANGFGIPCDVAQGADPPQRVRFDVEGTERFFDPSTCRQRWGPSLLAEHVDTLYLMSDGTWLAVGQDPFSFDVRILSPSDAVDWFLRRPKHDVPSELMEEFRKRQVGVGEESPDSHTQQCMSNNEEAADSPASADLLRVALPTAVIAATGLRDLSRVRRYYPDVIPEAEAKSLHEQLVAELISATKTCKLERVFEIARLPISDEVGSDFEFAAIMSVLVLNHPDISASGADVSSPTEMSERMTAVIRKCQDSVMEPVRGIVDRVLQSMLFDCRIPAPKGDDSFREPQRFLQMLRAYWGILRQLILHHIQAPAALQPHPLVAWVTNLKARVDACFDRLCQCAGAAEARETVSTLIEIVLSGEPDDLSVVPEWSHDQVGRVDRFIEEARLAFGAKSYPLTAAEGMCLEWAEKAVNEYEQQVETEWVKILQRQHTIRDTDDPPVPPPTAEQPKAENPEPRAFTGGKIVFFQDRVELCGVDICSGRRSRTRRKLLEMLRRKHRDGRYVRYSGKTLAKKLGLKGGEGSAGRAVMDLRDDISKRLKSEAHIECGRFDVIPRGDYRFSECITVQDSKESDATPITDMADENGVRNVRDDDVRDVRDHAATARRAWILDQLGEGRRLRVCDVVEQFKCHERTARRDLAALIKEGLVEPVGPRRTRYYRLRTPPDPDD